ncbi:MAG: tetratricopeptide repeat protein [Cyanobacteria bacterium SZAS LIN-5]|nr:tetratricopeptide repeat protein [Cyanobacteria bacterium SZAS LIN-5]
MRRSNSPNHKFDAAADSTSTIRCRNRFDNHDSMPRPTRQAGVVTGSTINRGDYMRLSALLTMVALTFGMLQPAATASANAGGVQAATNVVSNADGENALETGDYPRAQKAFSSALATGSSNAETEGYLRLGLGEALLWQGSLSDAGKQFDKAKSLLKNADQKLQARLLDDYAYYYQTQGKMDKALDSMTEALALQQANAANEPAVYVAAAMHLVNLLDRNGQLDKAEKIGTQALAFQTEKYGADSLMAANLNDQLGVIYRKQGKQEQSKRCFESSLQVKLNYNAVSKQYAPQPYWDKVQFRFLDGSPNCLRKFIDGNELEITTANGVTVGAAIAANSTTFAKYAQLNIKIRNDTDKPIQFLGQPPQLVTLTPKIYFAHLLDPTTLAQTVEKSGNKKAKWIRFWGENATQTMTSTMIGNGGMWGYQPIYSYGGAMPYISRNGNMTTMMTQVPDYAAQARALQKAADVTEKSQQTAFNIRSSSLGATTIAPGQTIEGSLYWDVPNFKNGILDLTVGQALFEFEFPPR